MFISQKIQRGLRLVVRSGVYCIFTFSALALESDLQFNRGWASAEVERPPLQLPRVGNGGGVWICRDRPSKEIRWMNLVDLFEAEVEYGYRLVHTGSLTPEQVFRDKLQLMQRVSPTLSLMTEQSARDLTWRILPTGNQLTVIHDQFIRVFPSPEACEDGYLFLGQLANYTYDGRLLISGDFWHDPAFSDMQRGALLIHEVIYKVLREQRGDKYSSRARHIVGVLFSDLPDREKSATIEKILAGSEPLGD